MKLKSSANMTKPWPPEQSPREAIELDEKVEIGPFHRVMRHTGEPVFDENLLCCPPAKGEMLKLNEYQVALVSPHPQERPQGRGIFPSDTATVLLSFSWADLVAGVGELLRNSTRLADRKVTQFADFCVDFIKMEVSRVSGEIINLNRQEFKILKCFLSNPGRVLSRDELLNEAWGYECYPSTRTVDNHVCRLRRKFEIDPCRPIHFRTVHGMGYKFVP